MIRKDLTLVYLITLILRISTKYNSIDWNYDYI